MEIMTFYKYVESIQQNLLITQFCEPLFLWFLDAASLCNLPTKSIRASWAKPKRDFVDPVKEVEAYALLVEQGFMAHSDVIKEMGRDPDEVYKEIENCSFQKIPSHNATQDVSI